MSSNTKLNTNKQNSNDEVKPNQFRFEDLDIEKMSNGADILSQLPSYNDQATNTFIREIETEVDEQKNIKRLLEQEDFTSNIDKIKDFTEKKHSDIVRQVSALEKCYDDLKKIVKENEELKKKSSELKNLIKEPNTSDVAEKLLRLKNLKIEIKNFLVTQGLREHQP